jgi:hypothetical protein
MRIRGGHSYDSMNTKEMLRLPLSLIPSSVPRPRFLRLLNSVSFISDMSTASTWCPSTTSHSESTGSVEEAHSWICFSDEELTDIEDLEHKPANRAHDDDNARAFAIGMAAYLRATRATSTEQLNAVKSLDLDKLGLLLVRITKR